MSDMPPEVPQTITILAAMIAAAAYPTYGRALTQALGVFIILHLVLQFLNVPLYAPSNVPEWAGVLVGVALFASLAHGLRRIVTRYVRSSTT